MLASKKIYGFTDCNNVLALATKLEARAVARKAFRRHRHCVCLRVFGLAAGKVKLATAIEVILVMSTDGRFVKTRTFRHRVSLKHANESADASRTHHQN